MQLQLDSVEARHPAAKPDAPSALVDLSLSIRSGEHVAVIGPSGAGKTTFLQLLAASLKPRAGEVLLDGQSVWKISSSALQSLRGQLFYAPQTPPLPPRQRVVTSLIAGALPSMSLLQSLLSLIYPRRIREAADALHAFDLDDKLWDRVDRLSGGERQRVGLARALMSPARLWLIDEPLSALDPTRARLAIDSLLSQATQRKATLVTTLHQVDVATSRFPRVIGLREGRVAFDLPGRDVTPARLAELYAQFEHELAEIRPTVIDTPASPEPARIIHCR